MIFITEGGEELGMGHMLRVAQLIKVFEQRGFGMRVFAYAKDQLAADFATEHYWGIWDGEECPPIMFSEVAIVDIMNTNNTLLTQLKARGIKHLVTIVGAGHTVDRDTHWISDLVVYQAPRLSTHFKKVPGENVLTGLSNIMVAPEFAEMSKFTPSVEAVVYFGGGMSGELLNETVMALNEVGISFEIAGHISWSYDMKSKYDKSMLYIGSMGMTVYEALTQNLQCIVVGRSPDHCFIAQTLEKKLGRHVIANLGGMDVGSAEDLAYEIARLASLRLTTYSPPICAPFSLDGMGVYRVANAIKELWNG